MSMALVIEMDGETVNKQSYMLLHLPLPLHMIILMDLLLSLSLGCETATGWVVGAAQHILGQDEAYHGDMDAYSYKSVGDG